VEAGTGKLPPEFIAKNITGLEGATQTRVTSMTPLALCRFGSVVALAMLAAPTQSAFAFNLEAQLQCSGDAMRLCSSQIPDVEKITACMKQQRELLSAGCRAVMERDEAAAGLQASRSRAQDPLPVGRQDVRR
jgi:hypothetical protein